MPIEVLSAISDEYFPNGSTTVFSFDFGVSSADEVIVIDGDGVEVSPALYTVSVNADEGGTVTFSSAPLATEFPSLFVKSNPDFGQPSEFGNNGPSFDPSVLTKSLDRFGIQNLRLRHDLERAPKVPDGEAGGLIPSLSGNAGKVLGVDGDGGFAFLDNDSASAAAEGFRDDAAASAATAESVAGPNYANTAAGIAGTGDGEAFAVDNGDDTVTVYLNDGGSAVAQRTLATTTALAAPAGSTLVGYSQGGAGAVERTLSGRLQDSVSAKDFAAGDGVTADKPKIQSASDKIASGGRLIFPRGDYLLSGASGVAITLGNGGSVVGGGTRNTDLVNTSGDTVIEALGGAGASKHFGVRLKDFRITYNDLANTTGTAINLKNQGKVTIENLEVEGHQEAGIKAQGVVGLRMMNLNFFRNNFAEVYNSPNTLEAVTTTVSFGTTRSFMEAGIKNSGITRQYVSVGGVWENFNRLIDNTGAIAGFTSIGEWFEGYGTGRITVAGDGVMSVATASDRKIDLGGIANPNFVSPYFSAEPEFVNAFNPRVTKAVFVPSGQVAEFYAKELLAPGQFEFEGSEFLWGAAATTESAFGLKSNLPVHGSWASPDEKFYKSGTFDSMANANQAGIWNGAGAAAHNRIWSELGDNAFPGLSARMYWPFTVNSPTRTTGIADPYGGTEAVQVDDGQYGTNDIPFAAGGGVWTTVVVVYRAVTAGDALHFSLFHVNGSGAQYNKTIELEVPDTEWRIAVFTQYLPPDVGIGYRMRLGTTTGGQIQFARYCCFEGAKALPPIRLRQEITTPFVFNHGNVILRGSAAPTAGQYHVGDRVELLAPTGDGGMGFVCTAGGAPGTWAAY